MSCACWNSLGYVVDTLSGLLWLQAPLARATGSRPGDRVTAIFLPALLAAIIYSLRMSMVHLHGLCALVIWIQAALWSRNVIFHMSWISVSLCPLGKSDIHFSLHWRSQHKDVNGCILVVRERWSVHCRAILTWYKVFYGFEVLIIPWLMHAPCMLMFIYFLRKITECSGVTAGSSACQQFCISATGGVCCNHVLAVCLTGTLANPVCLAEMNLGCLVTSENNCALLMSVSWSGLQWKWNCFSDLSSFLFQTLAPRHKVVLCVALLCSLPGESCAHDASCCTVESLNNLVWLQAPLYPEPRARANSSGSINRVSVLFQPGLLAAFIFLLRALRVHLQDLYPVGIRLQVVWWLRNTNMQ